MLDRILKTETRFLIVEKLVDCGPGDLYLARKISVGNTYTLRRIKETVGVTPEKIEALGALSHRGLPKIHDFFEEDGYLWLVSDFVVGENLQTITRQRKLTFEESRNWAIQLLDLFAYLHAHKYVYRSLWPGNFILDADGILRLAHLLPLVGAPSDAPSGEMRAFWAPELSAGEEPNLKTDVFALGVLIYRLITGQLPFEDDERSASSLASLCGGYLAPLDPVMAQALAAAPRGRFADAQAFANAFSLCVVEIAGAAVDNAAPTEFLSGTQVSRVLEGKAGAVNVQPSSPDRSISVPWSGGGEEDLPYKDQDTQKMDLAGIWASRSSVIKDDGDKPVPAKDDKTRAMGEETLRSILEKGEN